MTIAGRSFNRLSFFFILGTSHLRPSNVLKPIRNLIILSLKNATYLLTILDCLNRRDLVVTAIHSLRIVLARETTILNLRCRNGGLPKRRLPKSTRVKRQIDFSEVSI